MKRFLFLCVGLLLFFSGVLLFEYSYHSTVVFYHVLVMSLVIGGMALFLFLLSVLIKKKPLRNLLVTFFSALFLFLFLLFYVLVIGSNHFWHKTITLSILKNYATSFSDSLSIVPVQKGIILGFFGLYFLLNVLLFLLVRPRAEKIVQQTSFLQQPRQRNKLFATAGLLFLLLVVFHSPLMRFKRVMHMAEEPFLQFTLGAMWGNNNDIAFDKIRYQNGLKDKACTDSIRQNASNHTTVIILIDGLRADHLPAYGYTRMTTPFLDSMIQAKQLAVVRNAFSTSTNTIGGISGLFFSKDWTEFGFNGLSLMKFFKKAGFKTYAFLTGFHRDWYGLSALYRESCDVYYESSDNPDIKNDDDLVTLQKIKGTTIEKKSFVFIHLLSVHVIGKKGEAFKKFLPDKIGFGTDKKTALVNNYDNGLVQADFVIRNIFQKLKTENLLDNASVYVLADHGEAFGENGAWGHGDDVEEHRVTVPLLIYDSEPGWYKNLDAVTLKDVAPTIVDRIGSPVPFCWEGVSMHQPPHNFSVAVNSVEECGLPHGLLTRKDGSIKLEIMNRQKEVKRTAIKQGNKWITLN